MSYLIHKEMREILAKKGQKMSLYVPADSLKATLHFPTIMGQGATTCTRCEIEIQFNTWNRRYENIATGSTRCYGKDN